MAAELPTVHCSTEGLSRPEVIVLLVQAFRSLKWGVEHLHPMRVVAVTPRTAFSWGEEVIIDLDDAGYTAESRFQQWSPLAKKARLQRNLDALLEAFTAARSSTTAETIQAELKGLEESGVMELDASSAHSNEFKWKDIGMFFIPSKEFFATPILIDISVLLYILMVISGVHFLEPSGEDLLTWGANLRSTTLGGEYWRLLTCCFEHIGLIHLLLNMYALAMIGVHLEPLLGRGRMFLVYAVTGVVASLASLWWHENTISAGASGAIFGLYGLFLALLFTDLIHKETRKQLLQSIGIFVVYNLVYGLKGGVDNAAHIGGLVSGALLGAALYPALRNPERSSLQWGPVMLSSAGLLVAGAMVVRDLPADDAAFHQRIDTFQALEERGLSALRLAEGATGVQQLTLVQDSSLPAWREAVQLMRSTQDLQLSEATAEQRANFIAYAEIRLRNMELLEAALVRGDTETGAELEASFAQVDSILTILNGE